jgi:hypothetical protein
LIADDDRTRVLRPPTVDAFAAALREALAAGIEPARPARQPRESLAAWLDLVETVTPPRPPQAESVDEWAVVPDLADEALRDPLRSAQAASGADAVTTGVRTPDGIRLFLGEPGAMGLVENQYGVIGLVRREAVSDVSAWLLFARIALAGGRIVSIPDPLTDSNVEDSRADALAVLEAFESAEPSRLQGLPQLAATLGAALSRTSADGACSDQRRGLRRLLR